MSAPCFKCGTPCGRTACMFDGVEVAGGFLCAKHLDEAFAEMDVLRGQFEALLAAGVDRAEANRIMIARIDGIGVTV